MSVDQDIRRAEQLTAEGRLHEAVGVLRESLRRHARDPAINLHLAWGLHRTEHEDAARFAQRVLELRPPEAWLSLSAGWLLFHLGFDELVGSALALTKQNATEHDADLLGSVGLLAAQLAARRDRLDLAEDIFRDTYEYDPDDPQVGLELFAFLHNQGRHADARAHLAAMIRRAPDDEQLLALERETRREG